MSLIDPRKALADLGEKKSEDGEQGLAPITKIHLDVEGTRGKRYKHTFTFKVPTLGDQVKIAQLKANYLPMGAAADPNGFAIVEQVSFLTVTIDPKSLPDWWDVWNLYDATPISALYKEVTAYERRFHGGAAARDLDHGGEGVAPKAGQDGGGDDSEGDASVGEEASAPAQRRKTLASSAGRGA